jgi:hypothetical protein
VLWNVDRHRFDADPDPDPAFHSDGDSDPAQDPDPSHKFYTHDEKLESCFDKYSQQCQFTLFYLPCQRHRVSKFQGCGSAFISQIKNYNLPISRPPERTSKLQKKPSDLKRPSNTSKHELLNIFSTFVDHFCPSGSTDPIESGSNPDLDTDPQP